MVYWCPSRLALPGVPSLPGVTVAELLAQIAEIGLDPDTGGYHRYSFSEVDSWMRDWFVGQANERGLTTETDRNGNLWAARGDGPFLATGSHLDSVPNGGAFDGPLGIATAFAALDLADPQRDVAVVAFAEEEGARFGVACLGSRLMTGAIDAERARGLKDHKDIALETASSAAGIDLSNLGVDTDRMERIEAFIEVHIEQGRALVDLGSPVGVGESIWPHGRWRLDFSGRADHAGTTRMDDRDDPMLAYARTVLTVTEHAEKHEGRATFGRLEVEPNATNAIASRVTAWLDARAASDKELSSLVESVPATSGLRITPESVTPAVAFDPDLLARVTKVLGGPPTIPTAAGHDAGILAAHGIPTAMLFVRNPTGISHSPAEFANPEDSGAGVEGLAKLINEL